MAVYTWPPGLPQSPQKGYTEDSGVLILKTAMDAGPAKMRRRGKKPTTLNMNFLMTAAQVDTLEDFTKNIIRGTYRFDFKHPRTNATIEARMVPQDSGTLYNITYVAPGYYTISLQLEILP